MIYALYSNVRHEIYCQLNYSKSNNSNTEAAKNKKKMRAHICILYFTYKKCTRAVQKVRSRIFSLFFLCNTEINYQGENVQEVCTTTL